MKYFDYAATALPNTDILKEILSSYPKEYLFGNPSSNHNNGINARVLLEDARKLIARHLKCQSSEIYFTSGGSESNNTALKGYMLQFPKGSELIISSIEHPSILNTCKELKQLGYVVKYVSPDIRNTITVKNVERLITNKTKLISVMSVNNETGVINPINEIANLAHKNNVAFHSDMVQGVGLYNIDLSNIDIASFSGHKFGAIKGTGILYKKNNIKLTPLIQGGGQEKSLRSGTENVFGILDMALCFKETLINKWNIDKRTEIRKGIVELISRLWNWDKNKTKILSFPMNRVDNCLLVAFKDIDSRTLQLLLSQEGYCISVGSACHSNSNETVSYVVKEINTPEEFQNGVIRITVPPEASIEDIRDFSEILISKLNYLYESE